MILSLSTWINGQFVHHPHVDIGPVDVFTPAVAREALVREFGKYNNSIAWFGMTGYRFFKRTYKAVHRYDERADPRHYGLWDNFEQQIATDTEGDFAPDRAEDQRGD